MGLFIPKKYFFTQLSGIVVGCLGFLILMFGIKRLVPSVLDFDSGSVFIKMSFFVIAICFGTVGSMVVWGRILVMLRIFTKEEAKGYPYSKPWEKSR